VLNKDYLTALFKLCQGSRTFIDKKFQHFPGPSKRFPGPSRSPPTFKYKDKQQLLTVYHDYI